MQQDDRFVLTRAGYEALKRELETLEARHAEELRNYADVNYSSDPSKEEAAYFETKVTKEETGERIGYLKLVLQHAEIIDKDPDPARVDPGDRVTVWDFKERKPLQFDLVGSAEVVN